MGKISRRLISLSLAATLAVSSLFMSAFTTPPKEDRVMSILKSMTLEQKITQTFMLSIRNWNGKDMTSLPADVKKLIEDYDFGSFILFAQNVKTTEDTFKLTAALQEAATGDGGLPMLIAADQEGGIVVRLGTGTVLPGNMALAATGNLESATLAGEVIGSELAAVGINTDLAPVTDVNCNANNPVIGLRSFGDNPDKVGDYAGALIKGLKDHNIIGCLKHFPGHGDTDTDSHYGLPVVNKSYEEVMNMELNPYAKLAVKEADMIMTTHILYPGLDDTTLFSQKTGKEEKRPATMSKIIITDILKKKMGFGGVVITDAMDMQGITDTYDCVQSVVEALAAGIDIICMPAGSLTSKADFKKIDQIIAGVKKAVEIGYIPESRLDDAVTRILTLKEKRGILDYNPSDRTLEKAMETVGGKVNKTRESFMAASAVTLVRNKDNALPLSKEEKAGIVYLCPQKKEEGLCGGGNVYTYSKDDWKGGTNISSALKGKIDKADTCVIISEVSSAARMGYTEWHSAVPFAVSEYASKAGKKVIVISADKPYDVQLYPNADAVLAVYGKGANIAAGVMAVSGGAKITGTLPVNIPRFDFATGKYTDEIVYSNGFGIKLN